MSSERSGESRRSVLKKVAGGAALSVTFAGAAGAVPTSVDPDAVVAGDDELDPDREVSSLDVTPSDCSCETHFMCADTCYKDGSLPQLYEKECCTCDGDTVCEDTWTRSDQCCL